MVVHISYGLDANYRSCSSEKRVCIMLTKVLVPAMAHVELQKICWRGELRILAPASTTTVNFQLCRARRMQATTSLSIMYIPDGADEVRRGTTQGTS